VLCWHFAAAVMLKQNGIYFVGWSIMAFLQAPAWLYLVQLLWPTQQQTRVRTAQA
jgi:hypothetical protein